MADNNNLKPPVKSTPTVKPVAPTAKPVATAKPVTPAAKPAATVKPVTPAAKPVATAKPVTPAAKPAATVKPVTPAAKPAATVKPVTPAAKPAATVKPVTPAAKPVATAKPVTPAAKPAATVKPVTPAAAKPTPVVKTMPAAKPVPEPAEQVKRAAQNRTAKAETAATATPAGVKPATPAAPAKTAAAKSNGEDGKVKAAAMTRTENSKAKADTKPSKPTKGGGGAAATAKKQNLVQIIVVAAVCFVVILALLIGLVFGLRGCGSETTGLKKQKAIAINNYPAMTKAAYHAEETYDAKRNKPVEGVHDEAAAFGTTNGYPKYGSTLRAVIGAEDEKVAARQALINESAYLAAYGTRGANNDGKPDNEDKYTWMDKDGYLFRGSVSEPVKAMEIANLTDAGATYSDVQRRLYKHTASVGLYLGDVADNEPAITKKITLTNRGYTSYNITGVYAPAGEVLTVKLSGAAMNATGGIAVNIGQALYNSQANNIWAGKNAMNRMPHVLTTLQLNKNTMTYSEETDTWTGYIGSFLGGPVYIQNEAATYTVEISGGVTYSHFILGYTTPEEFEKNSKSSAPMFDLEVWEYGVLHSGPKNYVKNFSYNDLYNAAVYWEKVSLVTTQRGNGSKQGIVFIYDPFVAAGAAVAFPGRSSVNCPLGWMTQSLNYNSMITSGSWGNMHEYHHNFQGFGVGGGADGEVTNNSLNLVSYALFTNISAKRGIGSFGGAGLGGWNNYTSATWALNQVNNKAISSTNGLAVYSTLLHNFGADAFIKNAKGSNLTYWNNWSNFTGYDMSYYANLVSTYATGEKPAANPNRPMFIPVSCVYQTGRSYGTGDNKKYVTTMRPYVIPYGNEFEIDLTPYSAPDGQYASGSIVLPTLQDGKQTARFSYTVKNVTQPEHGKLEKIDDTHYKYIPNKNDKSLESGKIIVTLEITDTVKDDGAITYIDDVDLVLEFTQTHEMNKMTLDRTTYTYDADKMFTDAVDAYNAGFRGYNTVVTEAQYNPTQNVNTDIWFRPNNEATHNSYPNDPEKYFIHNNQIDTVDGKLYFGDDGKYRVYLRGRTNCALFFSLDGNDYELGATIKALPQGIASYEFRTKDSNSYFDAEFKEGAVTVTVYVDGGRTYNYTIKRDETGEFRNWVYIKEVLIDETTAAGVVSFIGVGTAQWTQTMFTMKDAYYTAAGAAVDSVENANYAYTQTTYEDLKGVAVAATRTFKNGSTNYYSITNGKYTDITGADFAKLTEPKLIEPTSAAYANAYRTTYEFRKSAFTSEYFYTRNHEANYRDNVDVAPVGSLTLIDNNYVKPPTGWGWGNYPVENITDNNKNTYIHTSWKVDENRPLNLTFDMGEEKTSNRITITSRNNNGMGEGPGSFTLLGSLDGEVYFEVGTFTGLPKQTTTTVDYPETTFRYFKISITASQPTAPYYIVIGSIVITHSTEVLGGKLYSPDNDMFTYSGSWSQATVHSNYGHVFVGKKGASVDFTFEGTQLGIISSNSLGQKFEVYIDGKKVESIKLKQDDGTSKYTYISSVLKSGKHTVQIKCTGEANFDSIAVFNHPEAE